MKILQINAVNRFGSTGRTCKELADYINQSNENICYTAFSVGEQQEYEYQIGSKLDRKLHAFLSRLTCRQGWFSARATRKLIGFMEQIQPDVVHLRNLHSNFVNVPMLLKYLAKKDIATVVTLHDCWFYTGKCCHYTVENCSKWKSGCYDCPQLRKGNASWFFDATDRVWLKKKALFEALPRLAVVGVSEWITEEARQSFLRCAKEVVRIYNWIDLDTFTRKETAEELRNCYAPNGEKIILGVASGWSKNKGLDDFLKLAKLLGETYRICLVGGMPKGIELPKNVCHIPTTNSPDALAELYSMADVFVTLSAEETFGKVSAEALACGTPVVCYDSTANKELVGSGCGEVCALGDLQAIADAVKTICKREDPNVAERCRTFAEENFSKEQRILDYLSLYESMLSQ